MIRIDWESIRLGKTTRNKINAESEREKSRIVDNGLWEFHGTFFSVSLDTRAYILFTEEFN